MFELVPTVVLIVMLFVYTIATLVLFISTCILLADVIIPWFKGRNSPNNKK